MTQRHWALSSSQAASLNHFPGERERAFEGSFPATSIWFCKAVEGGGCVCECCALVVCTAWRKCPCLASSEDMARPGWGWRTWPCFGETGGNIYAFARLEEMSMLWWSWRNVRVLVRLEETAMPWWGQRKQPFLGKTGGNVNALARLEDMVMPWWGWRKWLCLGEIGGNGHPSPMQVLLQGRSISSREDCLPWLCNCSLTHVVSFTMH